MQTTQQTKKLKTPIKILLALLSVTLLGCGGTATTHEHAHSLRVENKSLRIENDSVRLDLNYPVVVSSDHTEFDKAFNEHIESLVKKLSTQSIATSQKDADNAFESTLRWNMHYGEKIVALEWGGFTNIDNSPKGFHGDFRGVELFDTHSGKLRAWSDFIEDGDEILDIIARELQGEQIAIAKSKKLHLPDFFTIDSLVLTAVYAVGTLASSEFGEIEIPIPLEDLDGALKLEELAPETLYHVKNQ